MREAIRFGNYHDHGHFHDSGHFHDHFHVHDSGRMREAIRFGNEHGHEEVEDLAKCSKPFIFSLMILIKIMIDD